jgi:flavodoxin
MGYKVVYFSRTNISKRVAEKIAEKLSCDKVELTDNMDWSGALGFIKGGYYASKNKDVEIKINGDLAKEDDLVVVTPLWAGGAVPAIKTFLKDKELNKIHLVVTSNGSTIKDSTGFKSVTDIVKKNNNEDELIDSLINHLS